MCQFFKSRCKDGIRCTEVYCEKQKGRNSNRQEEPSDDSASLHLWKERKRKEDWLGRVSDYSIVLRKLHPGHRGVPKPEPPVREFCVRQKWAGWGA